MCIPTPRNVQMHKLKTIDSMEQNVIYQGFWSTDTGNRGIQLALFGHPLPLNSYLPTIQSLQTHLVSSLTQLLKLLLV